MTLNERAAYIKGLAEGMELDTASKEGKVIAALIELCSDMAEEIAALDERVDTVHAYCEELDEDLGAVEEILLEDDDEEWDDDEVDCDGDCCNCDEDCDLADEDYFEVECPSCGDVVCFDGSIDPEELTCPACGEKFECLVSEEDLKALDAE
ncbi:MAG: hypothetical protein IJY42_00550 [Clostridia bacterium]|nr:hypothetical protein [Clostridia bacterium]MBQ9783440.1 hypothetical protein [Clostridia bacterium]